MTAMQEPIVSREKKTALYLLHMRSKDGIKKNYPFFLLRKKDTHQNGSRQDGHKTKEGKKKFQKK